MARVVLIKRLCSGISVMVKKSLLVRKFIGEIGRCRQRLASAATFLRRCVVRALSRGDGSAS